MNVITMVTAKEEKRDILLIQNTEKKIINKRKNITYGRQGKSPLMIFTLEQLGLNKMKS